MYSMARVRDAMSAVPWLLLALPRFANAACECGYSVNQTTDQTYAQFTDLTENDFLHSAGTNLAQIGWSPQQYDVSAEDARGPYGKQFQVTNVELNPLKDPNTWSGDSEKGGDAGLRLWVRADHSNGLVGASELASVRNDALYGSFRVGLKLSPQNGTCGAFFWFHNNSQEIDMEFLSHQFYGNEGIVNLVMQTPESVKNGYNAADTPTYRIQPLNFAPDEKFHEYRFDWTPDRVSFYVDGEFLYEMRDNLPVAGGKFIMNHWSNGDYMWSAGPPEVDAPMVVSYVKAYFNSSSESSGEAYRKRCPNFDPSRVCAIPAQTVAPDGADAKTYFFSQDGKEKTPGQVRYPTTNSGASELRASLTYVTILATLFAWAMH